MSKTSFRLKKGKAFISMMTISSSIGMKHHKHWELIEWFLLLELQFPGMNRLVIDAGTCVIMILLMSDKYLGGAIAPGLRLRYESLHNLPLSFLVIFGSPKGVWGLQQGINSFWSCKWFVYEIDGFIEHRQFVQIYNNFNGWRCNFG
jgi:hypothetical protein